MDYLIGQRLILNARKIVTVIETPDGCMPAAPYYQWVRLPDVTVHCVHVSHLQELPNGQL